MSFIEQKEHLKVVHKVGLLTAHTRTALLQKPKCYHKIDNFPFLAMYKRDPCLTPVKSTVAFFSSSLLSFAHWNYALLFWECARIQLGSATNIPLLCWYMLKRCSLTNCDNDARKEAHITSPSIIYFSLTGSIPVSWFVQLLRIIVLKCNKNNSYSAILRRSFSPFLVSNSLHNVTYYSMHYSRC